MSLFERIEGERGGDGVEQGKRLIRADEGGLSLAERLAYRLHRLAWRTPFHAVRLRGRFPLKLLAVPKDPIAGDKAAGEAMMLGSIVYGRESVALDALDFADRDISAGFREHLQSFAWLRDLAAAETRERASPLAEAVTKAWLAGHAGQLSEAAWQPALWGRRIFFWTAYAPYILSSKDMVYRSAVLNTLARGARHVESGAEKAPAGLARISAWAGLIAAGLLVQGGPQRLGRGEAGLVKALAEGLHDDGGLKSRSPSEQLRLVELLAQLRTCYLARREQMPESVAEALSAAVAALLAARLGDEALSSWQGGNMESARGVRAVVEGAGVAARPLRQARGWGYQHAAAKALTVVMDGAPPPAARVLKGGCASTLAIEASDGAERLIVNCGGVGARQGLLAEPLVQALRTTAAHSTLTLGDRNSTAIHDDGSIGKGVSEVEIARTDLDGTVRIEAAHDGYVRRFGLAHQREIYLSSDGRELRGEDRLVPRGRKRGEARPFAVRFHLAPAVEATTTADGHGALLRIRGGRLWQFRCRGGDMDIEESIWIDGEARPHRGSQLVISGESPADGISIGWTFRTGG
ncbi:MAG: heparinase II/III family protein [Sphingomonadaceae bacterium]